LTDIYTFSLPWPCAKASLYDKPVIKNKPVPEYDKQPSDALLQQVKRKIHGQNGQ
jgi:hypothetical protein